MKLEIRHLAAYLPYGLQCYNEVHGIQTMDCWSAYSEIKSGNRVHIQGVINGSSKPILRPLSDLTKEIKFNLTTYAFTDLFEIGDTDGCCFEFDSGNIKLISNIESISKHNSHYDINYLPYPVVQMMLEHHFDIFGLIESGLAINVNTLNKEQ